MRKIVSGALSATPARDDAKVLRRLARASKWPRRVFRILVATVLIVVGGFVVFLRQIDNNPPGTLPAVDAIVALTGGEARIPEAVNLLANGHGRRLLISGVHPDTTREQITRLIPKSRPLFRCCIDLDTEARDTIGNANETAEWARRQKVERLIVVTSGYHMPRSLVELRRAMPQVEFVPYSVRAKNLHLNRWWAYPGTLRLLLSEYVKFVPAFLRCKVAQWRSAADQPAPKPCFRA